MMGEQHDHVWRMFAFSSGTHIVTRAYSGEPHYYVYADRRESVCRDLVKWLNDGVVPSWASSLKLSSNSDESCKGVDGIEISATGPMVEGKYGVGHWEPDIDPAKVDERVALIRRLLEGGDERRRIEKDGQGDGGDVGLVDGFLGEF